MLNQRLELSAALVQLLGSIIYPTFAMQNLRLWGPRLADRVNPRNCLTLLIKVSELLHDDNMLGGNEVESGTTEGWSQDQHCQYIHRSKHM